MKTIALSLILLAGIHSYAQDTQTQEPRKVTDKTMSDKFQKDLSTRNTSLGNTSVTWYDAGYGYYGTYSQNNKDYMVRYDRNGKYVETLQRKEWDNTISASTQNAFKNSEYADQRVTAYWETTDPGKKGSYYELTDATGKKSRIWADENGQFSNQPTGSTTTNRP